MKNEMPPRESALEIMARVERMLPPDLDVHSSAAVKRFLYLCLSGLLMEGSLATVADASINDLAAAAAQSVGFTEELPVVDFRDGGIAAGLVLAQKGNSFDRLQAELQRRIQENERTDKVFALLCARE